MKQLIEINSAFNEFTQKYEAKILLNKSIVFESHILSKEEFLIFDEIFKEFEAEHKKQLPKNLFDFHYLVDSYFLAKHYMKEHRKLESDIWLAVRCLINDKMVFCNN